MTTYTDGAATWNKRFETEAYVFGREPNAYLRANAAHLPRARRALCVADGEGRNSVWLAQQGLQVDAFDIAGLGVAKARKLAAEAGVSVSFSVADCEQWPWPREAYGAVVAVFVQFADPAQRERLFARMAAALEPGGVLLLLGYSPRQLEYKTGGPGLVSHLYTPELLRSSFAALEIVALDEYEAELAEGTAHAGRSALIGLVARKP